MKQFRQPLERVASCATKPARHRSRRSGRACQSRRSDRGPQTWTSDCEINRDGVTNDTSSSLPVHIKTTSSNEGGHGITWRAIGIIGDDICHRTKGIAGNDREHRTVKGVRVIQSRPAAFLWRVVRRRRRSLSLLRSGFTTISPEPGGWRSSTALATI
jgi:hypothetical protein